LIFHYEIQIKKKGVAGRLREKTKELAMNSGLLTTEALEQQNLNKFMQVTAGLKLERRRNGKNLLNELWAEIQRYSKRAPLTSSALAFYLSFSHPCKGIICRQE
jgi:hypothetical protein